MVKKFVAFVLIFSLLATAAVRPIYATGAESVIIGGLAGAPALSGVALTAPQIALLVAAGFGLIYAVDHAEEIADGLHNAMEAAASGVANGAQQLSKWWEQAEKGLIALETAPAWLLATIRGWVSDQYANAGNPVVTGGVELGVTQTASVDTWNTTAAPYYFRDSVDVLRLAHWYYSDDGYFNYTIKMFVIPVGVASGRVYYNQTGDSSYWKEQASKLVLTQSGSVSPDNKTEYDNAAKAAAMALPFVADIRQPCCEEHGTVSTFNSPAGAYIRCMINQLTAGATGSVCPDKTVGGIGQVLEDGHSIDAVTVPDMAIAGSASVCPDAVKDGSVPIGDTVSDVIVGLTDGTISWTDYVADVGIGTPTVAIPGEGAGVLEYPITDTGVSDVPLEGTETKPGEGTETEAPAGLAPYLMQLREFFPFCIPFDIAEFFDILCAEPEAPCFDWEFPNPGTGGVETLTIDLSVFDPVAQLLRNMELLLLCVGLAFATRGLIRG